MKRALSLGMSATAKIGTITLTVVGIFSGVITILKDSNEAFCRFRAFHEILGCKLDIRDTSPTKGSSVTTSHPTDDKPADISTQNEAPSINPTAQPQTLSATEFISGQNSEWRNIKSVPKSWNYGPVVPKPMIPERKNSDFDNNRNQYIIK